jgi:hypothetical protein
MFSYAMVDGEPAVFLVTRGVKQGLLKDVDTLRDKSVWHFDAGLVTAVDSSVKGGGFSAVKRDGQWRIKQGGKTLPAIEGEIEDWLDLAGRLRVEKFVAEDDTDKARYGLSGKGPRLALKVEGAPDYALHLGSESGGGDTYFARRQGVPKIFSLKKGDVEGLRRQAADLIQPPATPTPQAAARPADSDTQE